MTKYSMKRLLLMTMLCCMLTGLLLLVPVDHGVDSNDHFSR